MAALKSKATYVKQEGNQMAKIGQRSFWMSPKECQNQFTETKSSQYRSLGNFHNDDFEQTEK